MTFESLLLRNFCDESVMRWCECMNNSILLQIASYSQNFAIDFIIPRVAQAMSYSLNYIQLFLLNLKKLSSRIDTAMTNDD